jgi:hypothetical protein
VMIANRLIDGPSGPDRAEDPEGADEVESDTQATDAKFRMGFTAKETQ